MGDSLALLYAAFSTSLFVVPRLIDRFGARRTIFIGSSTYVIFICTLIHVISPVFLAASAVNGVGGALLWTSQGNLLTRCVRGCQQLMDVQTQTHCGPPMCAHTPHTHTQHNATQVLIRKGTESKLCCVQ